MADIQNINTYMGDAALAQGSSAGGGGVASEPFRVPDFGELFQLTDRMMYYQFAEKKDRWARQNLLADRDADLAAEMGKFPLSEWLPQDSEEVTRLINEYNAYYGNNPSAVRLRTDPKTGKILNQEQYQELQNRRNRVLEGINHANFRKSKIDGVRTATDAITSPTKRAEAEKHYATQAAQPFYKDIYTYPDLKPYDLSTDKPPQTTPKIETAAGGYFTLDEYKIPDVYSGRSLATIKMNAPGGEDYQESINQLLARWKPLIDQTQTEHGDWDDSQVIEYLATTAGAADLAAAYKIFLNNRQTVADLHTLYPKMLGLPQVPPMVRLKDLDAGDASMMIQSSLGEWDGARTLKVDPTVIDREQMRSAERIAAGKNATDIKLAGMRGSGGGGDGAKAQPGAVAAQALVTLSNYPTLNNAKPLGMDDIMAALPHAKKEDLGDLLGVNTNDYNIYKVDMNPTYANMFRQRTPGEIQVRDTIPGSNLTQMRKQNELDIEGQFIIQPKNGDIDQNRYVTVYHNPATNQVSVKKMNNQDLGLAANRVLDYDGTATSDALNNVAQDYQKLLNNQYGLVQGAPLSELTKKYYGISPQPVKVGGAAQQQPLPPDQQYTRAGTTYTAQRVQEAYTEWKKNNSGSTVTLQQYMAQSGITPIPK